MKDSEYEGLDEARTQSPQSVEEIMREKSFTTSELHSMRYNSRERLIDYETAVKIAQEAITVMCKKQREICGNIYINNPHGSYYSDTSKEIFNAPLASEVTNAV